MREMAPCVSASDSLARMLCVCPTNAGCKHRLLIGRRHVECMSHQVMGFWKRTNVLKNFIIFRKAAEWRYHKCISEIPRIYKVIYSPIHKTTPPPSKRVKWNKINTQQRFQGPNQNYFSLFFGINAIIFRKAAEWRYRKCISEISRIYKVIHSSIHKTTPPPPFTQKSKMKQKKYSTTISRS